MESIAFLKRMRNYKRKSTKVMTPLEIMQEVISHCTDLERSSHVKVDIAPSVGCARNRQVISMPKSIGTGILRDPEK